MHLYFFLLLNQLDPGVQGTLLKALEDLKLFQVDFVQETYSDFLDDTVASGVLIISRPGRMRMTYLKGDRKIMIWDGETAYERDMLADTEARQAMSELRGEPLVQILLYGSNLLDHFIIDRIKMGPKKVFRLRPRAPDNYEVLLELNSDNQPGLLEVVGNDGEGTRFHFSNFQTNPQISDDTFAIPAAVD